MKHLKENIDVLTSYTEQRHERHGAEEGFEPTNFRL